MCCLSLQSSNKNTVPVQHQRMTRRRQICLGSLLSFTALAVIVVVAALGAGGAFSSGSANSAASSHANTTCLIFIKYDIICFKCTQRRRGCSTHNRVLCSFDYRLCVGLIIRCLHNHRQRLLRIKSFLSCHRSMQFRYYGPLPQNYTRPPKH